MRRLRLSDERGGALVMVALFMVALVAMVAFAIDTGALYEERRELQNAADAAVLAIAEDCGWGIAPCDDAYATSTAESYSDSNSLDDASAVGDVALDIGAQKITVGTQTEASDGGTILKPFFAQLVGFDGATVGATATAIWGHPAGMGTIPLVVSECEWDAAPDPAEGPPFDGAPWLFYLHRGQGPPDPESCTAQAGQDWDLEDYLPGGFGWLESDDCWVDSVIGDWVLKDPGASVSSGCSASELRTALLGADGSGRTVNFPYFDKVRGNGTVDPGGGGGELPPEESGRGYRILGYGAIHVTGYNFGGQFKEPSTVTGALPCNGDDRCLEGYITFATDSGGPVGGPDLGILIVKLTG